MTPRRQRLTIFVGTLAALGIATALVLNAFRSNLVFFYSPSQVAAKEAPAGRTFRLGGLVQRGSLKRDGTQVQFIVTDTVRSVTVRYDGILPTCSRRARAWSHKAPSGTTACSSRARCSPSTTRTTCPPRPARH